jgi:hypothetical protein
MKGYWDLKDLMEQVERQERAMDNEVRQLRREERRVHETYVMPRDMSTDELGHAPPVPWWRRWTSRS